jgi:hypothetical protein
MTAKERETRTRSFINAPTAINHPAQEARALNGFCDFSATC